MLISVSLCMYGCVCMCMGVRVCVNAYMCVKVFAAALTGIVVIRDMTHGHHYKRHDSCTSLYET